MPEVFEINAVYDPNLSAAREFWFCVRGNVIIETSVEVIFHSSEIDAVIIASPHLSEKGGFDDPHLNYAEAAIAAGKHVLCEKPLWLKFINNNRASVLFKRAKNKGLVFTSCHPRRFDRELVAVSNQLPTYREMFGELMQLSFRFFYGKPPTGWREDDSLLLDHMNHELDFTNFLLGDSSVELKRFSNGADHYVVAGVRRNDGVVLSFSGSRRLEEPIFRNELELAFERGRVTIHSILSRETGEVNAHLITENFGGLTPVTDDKGHYPYADSFRGIMENFAGAIRGQVPNYLSSHDLYVNTAACTWLVETGEYSD